MTELVRSPSFGQVVAAAHAAGSLVVQPRMGMSDPTAMRQGLLATKQAKATTVGTITLDSYTRIGSHHEADRALAAGMDLNGYPIVSHSLATTAGVLDGVLGPEFPVQVRHGSPCPEQIIEALINVGLHATEGGPVSYCLPYSRLPLETATANWARGCDLLAGLRERDLQPHLETFGGCMLGQLCPPSLLVALSMLEAMFFRQHGIVSLSLSYAQQTNVIQDQEAVFALRRLAGEYLTDAEVHVVLYAYMGVYPRTHAGADRLLAEAAALAVHTGAARLIVKTAVEASRIPSVAENVAALELAAVAATAEQLLPHPVALTDTGIYAEAKALIESVLELNPDIGHGLILAFQRGYLDVPFCLHPDNPGRSRSYLDDAGWLRWSEIGSMPIPDFIRPAGHADLTAAGLLSALSYVERTFDEAGLTDTARAIEENREWSITP